MSEECYEVTIHRSERIAPDVILGYSDDFPDKQFLLIVDPEEQL